MLTLDMVRAYRRGDALKLRAMSKDDRDRARNLAARYIEITKACMGKSRRAFDQASATVTVDARDRKLAAGLRKLIVDRCDFAVAADGDVAELRRAVFECASARRQALQPGERFDRHEVLARVAAERGMEPDELDRLLYVDLRSAHCLRGFAALSPEALVEIYTDAQAQAVLLRAVRVKAYIYSATPEVYRVLFRKLKFLRLLHVIEPADNDAGGYNITIDGPYSMFRANTQYGLQLALLMPALRACDRWSLNADVLWGKQRQPLGFTLASAPGQAEQAGISAMDEPRLPDEVAALRDRVAERFAAGKSKWQARPCSDIVHLPGVGLCVPDLEFIHADTGECVYFEALGYWSRQAVWQRVELVERGLPHRIVFAVSKRLRVSEAALGTDLPGALYVYKGVMSARAVEERLDAVCATKAEVAGTGRAE